jgi:hypothetical protein
MLLSGSSSWDILSIEERLLLGFGVTFVVLRDPGGSMRAEANVAPLRSDEHVHLRIRRPDDLYLQRDCEMSRDGLSKCWKHFSYELTPLSVLQVERNIPVMLQENTDINSRVQ